MTNNAQSTLAGNYAHRFSGFSMDNDTPFYVVGVGLIQLKSDGTLSGRQKSSTTQIAGQGASLMHASFTLSGKWTDNADGTGSVEITFTSSNETMTGTFDFVSAGSDRLWLISSGATLAPNNQAADEVVTGEAVRIG